MIVVPGPASQELGKRIAEKLGVQSAKIYFRKFPDGETYIRLEDNLKGEELVVVQTTSPPQETHLMQLFLMADTAKDLGAKKVIAVVPYLAYARQDKRFLPGEAVSIRTISKLLATSGVDSLLTVNVHKEKVLKKIGFPAESLSVMTLLAEHLKKKGLANAFALAPDEGASEWAEEASQILGGGFGWLRKKRDKYTGEITTEQKQFNVEGRDVIIFDDIISSGRTTANAVKILKKQKARRVYAACAHPLLIGDARQIIIKNGAEAVVGTDSVPSSISVVSVAPLIARALTEKEEP
jgi:ribose-phosphate pyrophosphokinase